ncbi:DUF2169 domain-containing protein [Sorangium sp. So ce726]|uniref:DUF2169 family type VI secretion system accessory protein n=1 Tax=Sorangium sp. So ce726 TaxID=3133319 RepID=UPI003F60EBF5
MEVLAVGPLPVASLLWQPRPGAWMFTFVCKATFVLRPGESPLAPEQEALLEADAHWRDDPAFSLYASTDIVPIRPRVDVVLVGHAFAPGQALVRSLVARLAIAEIDKSIEVVCDRSVTKDGAAREGQPFARMPLLWERAAGGADTVNAVGAAAGARDAYGARRLPNLVPPGTVVSGPDDVVEPIGFGPVAPSWLARRSKLGRHAAAFASGEWQRSPLPADIDASYFNAAPPDQQLAALRGDERLVLENLHPEHPHLATRLAGERPQAFVERPGQAPQPVAMRADLLWIHTDRAVCALTWRGQIPLAHPHDAGVVRIGLVSAPASAPISSARRESEPGEAREVPSSPRSSDPGARAARGAVRVELAANSLGETVPTTGAGGVALPFVTPAGAPQPSQAAKSAFQRFAGMPFVASPAVAPPAVAPPAVALSAGAPASGAPTSVASAAAASLAIAPTSVTPPAVAPTSVVPPAVTPAAVAPPAVAPTSVAPAAVALPAVAPMSVAPVAVAPAAVAPPAAVPRPAVVPPAAESPWAAGASRAPGAPAPTFGSAAVQAQASPAPPVVPPRSDAAPAPARPSSVRAPATARSSASEIVHLLWYDPESVPRVRRQPSFRPLLEELDERPIDREADEPALAKDPMAVEDRREVFEIIARASATDAEGTQEAVVDAVREGGKFVPPVCLLAGELIFHFDELETLKATVTAAAPLAGNDEQLKAAVVAAQDFLKLPDLRCAPSVAEGLTTRIKEALDGKRGAPPGYLKAQTERVLLDQRHYQKRPVLGGPHLRALLQPSGSSQQIPAYLPEALAQQLPLYQRFRSRLVAELHLQVDQSESHAVALRVLALARVAPLPARR